MAKTRKTVKRTTRKSAAAYEAHRDREQQRKRKMSAAGRDIAPLPEIENPERRANPERNFRLFCETYFAATFYLPWSADHLRVIDKIERAVLEGGLFAMAMPRGSGKTSLCETACIWALLYGHREFVVVVGSDKDRAEEILASMQSELETNELLLADFPEVCYPIQAVERVHQRANAQTYNGVHTRLRWTSRTLVLPTIEGSRASGSVLKCVGLTGSIRGMKHKRADGSSIRPSLVLLDDPQTDASARSPSQCAARESLVAGAILGLAGPGRKIAGLAAVTVIRPGDLADRMLDPEQYPQWRGVRLKMLYAFPENEELWERYAELWREGERAGGDVSDATTFYREHRAEMDRGAKPAWEQWYDPGELSAVQHAMNMRLERRDAAFYAEYQNEPLPEVAAALVMTPTDVAARLNGVRAGIVPSAATCLTAFVDPHGRAHYWMVVAWEQDATAYVVAYGTEPKQPERYFALRTLSPTLLEVYPGLGLEATVRTGLDAVWPRLSGEWQREDGSVMRVSRCLIDANWGKITGVVYEFCRAAEHSAILLPSHGMYLGAANMPFDAHRKKPGDKCGPGWRIPAGGGSRGIRHIVFDTNQWKSWVQARLTTPLGSRGALTLHGKKAEPHQLLSEHLTAETPIETTAKHAGVGRKVDEWRIRQPGIDNHWLDCLVGCAVGASMEGVTPPGGPATKPVKRATMTYAEFQRQKRAARQQRQTWGTK